MFNPPPPLSLSLLSRVDSITSYALGAAAERHDISALPPDPNGRLTWRLSTRRTPGVCIGRGPPHTSSTWIATFSWPISSRFDACADSASSSPPTEAASDETRGARRGSGVRRAFSLGRGRLQVGGDAMRWARQPLITAELGGGQGRGRFRHSGPFQERKVKGACTCTRTCRIWFCMGRMYTRMNIPISYFSPRNSYSLIP